MFVRFCASSHAQKKQKKSGAEPQKSQKQDDSASSALKSLVEKQRTTANQRLAKKDFAGDLNAYDLAMKSLGELKFAGASDANDGLRMGILLQIAETHSKINDHKQAIANAQQVIACVDKRLPQPPSQSECAHLTKALYLLGTFLRNVGKDEDATTAFSRCLKICPNHAGAKDALKPKVDIGAAMLPEEPKPKSPTQSIPKTSYLRTRQVCGSFGFVVVHSFFS